MKRQFSILALMMTLLSFSSFAAAQTTLVARLTGAQEVPPVATEAGGLALLTLNASRTQLTYNLIVNDLENVTAAHIHRGELGVAGPVVYPLASGDFTHNTGVIDINPGDVLPLLSGGMYINVHTTQNPPGEIRGQIVRPAEGTFVSLLNGSQENPAVDTTGDGIAIVSLDETGANLTYQVIVHDLTDITAAHIHTGGVGVNGPVIIPIASGPFSGVTGSAAVTAEQAAALAAGGLYINVHTTANPSGEIRGQLFTPLRDEIPNSENNWIFPLVISANAIDSATGQPKQIAVGQPVRIGTMVGASDGYSPAFGADGEPEDILGPTRPPFDFATLAVVHTSNEPGFENRGGLYIKDVRSPIVIGETETWDRVILSTDLGTQENKADVVITWPNLANISDALTFTLTDGERIVNMRETNSIVFRLNASPQQPIVNIPLKVIVSNTRAIPRPVISTLEATQVGATSVTLSWITDVESNSVVRFGTSADNLDRTVQSDGSMTTAHSVVITDLNPNTQYFFEVSSAAPGLDTATATTTVTTLRAINPVGAITAQSQTPTTATLAFQTDVPTTATVFYGTDANDLTSQIAVSEPTTEHLVAIGELQPGTQYFARIVTQAEGAEDLVQTTTFTTLGPLTVNNLAVSNITGNSARITVTTNHPTTVSLAVGTDLNNNPRVLTSDTLGTSHVFDVTGLNFETAYRAQATASATGFGTAQSNVATFTTQRLLVIQVGPTITLTPESALISFTTDVGSTGEIRYGTTPDLGSVRRYTNPVRPHNVSLTGLQPNTTYYYQIVARGSGRAELITAVQTFTTPAAIRRGDVNNDNVVNTQDVTLALRHVIGLITLTNEQIQRADVVPVGNPDGQVDLRDVTRILRATVGLETL